MTSKIILFVIILVLVLCFIFKYSIFNYKESFPNNPKVILITRFSILDCDTESFRLTKYTNKCHDIKKKLFNKTRLENKFMAFKNITYPSIAHQTYKNYEWWIFTSDMLPPEYLRLLENIITSSYTTINKIKIIPVKNMSSFFKLTDMKLKKVSKKTNYISLRIDDDDGLSPYFLKNLIKYKDKSGSIISFPNGMKVKIENGKIVFGEKTKSKNIASAGLAAVNKNIYKCGNHTKVDKKYNVIYDNLENAYIQFCSEFTDTKRKF